MKHILILLLAMTSCVANNSDKPEVTMLKVLWSKQTNNIDAPDAKPLVIENSVVVYYGEVDLVAVSTETGKEQWRGVIDGQRALTSDVLLYDKNRKRVLSNHMKDVKVWDSETGNNIYTLSDEDGIQAFVLGKHTILNDGYGIIGDTLDAYILEPDGSIKYTIQVPFASAGLAFWSDKLFMTQAKTVHGALTLGKIRAFDAQTGDSLWSYDTENGGFVRAAPIVENGILYAGAVGNSPIKEFVALDAETGEVIWRQTDWVRTDNFLVGPKYVYVNTGGTLAALDKVNGSIAWRFEWTSSAGLVTPVYLEGYVYHSDHNRMFVLDGETGELVHEEPVPEGGSYFWHLAVSSDKLYAQTSRQLIAYQPWHLREE
jgi:outer membrane protein assembly factor BamB